MITLLTGSIGSGKTLYCCSHFIDYLNTYDKIYTNIEGFHPDFYWHNSTSNITTFELDFTSEAMQDYITQISKYGGSKLVVIDEAAFYFLNDRKQMDKDFLKLLAYTRHYGLDIIFICQNPAQLHYQIRHLVNYHIHIRRKFNTGMQTILEKEGIIYEVQNNLFLRESVKSGDIVKKRAFIKKMYFDAYKSSAVYTKYKTTLSLKHRFFLILLLLLPIFGFYHLEKYLSNNYFTNLKNKSASSLVPKDFPVSNSPPSLPSP